MVKKRIPYWQDQPMSLSEWQEAIERNLLSLNQDLNRLVQNSLKQPTTAPTTQTAPTEEEQWAAAVDTRLTMIESLQSDQADTKSGHVEHSCTYATLQHWTFNTEPMQTIIWCQECGALTVYGRTHVLVADRTSSTSVKQPLKESVENSQEESVQSQSKSFHDYEKLWDKAVKEFGPGWADRVIQEMERN